MTRRLSLILLVIFTAAYLSITNTGYTADEEFDVDQVCSDRLEGTMSAETCLAACTTPGFKCGLAITYDADTDDELSEDLDCYGCRKLVCADFGRLNAAGKANCDAQPDKKSVAAPPLPDGTPCWTCVDKKDTCDDKWKGSTVMASCQAICPKATHQCKFVGKHDGKDCYNCIPNLPPPPPPKLCKDWGLLVAGQCKTCKDPTPLCVPAGVAASNGPCFQCEKKPKIKCSDYGLKDSCKCKDDEVVKWTWVTKVTPSGIKVRKRCCQCVKKPKECKDINLYTSSECKQACKKPGVCKKAARSQKGDCYDCVSPVTCEEKDYETSCRPCTEAGLDCRDVTTVEGVKCKECFKRQCPEQGLPGSCPGTCKEGLLCIPRKGPCHICMKVKKITVTWIIIIIETPYGRVVLDKDQLDSQGLGDFEPVSIMALATPDPAIGDLGKTTDGLAGIDETFSGGKLETGDLSDIAERIKQGLSNRRKQYSIKCFDEFDQADALKSPPGEAASGLSYGRDYEKDVILNGPVISCGIVKGKNAIAVFDASGALVKAVMKEDMEANPNSLQEALDEAVQRSQTYLASEKKEYRAQPIKTKASSSSEGEKDPNDPLYQVDKKKKKKLFGVLGSSKKAKVSVGIGMKFGMGTMGGPSDSIKARTKGPEVHDQWGLKKVGYLPRSNPDSAWNIIDGDQKNVVVAIIDSGLDFTHPDGPAYTWTNDDEIPDNDIDDDANGYVDDVRGWNFLNNNNDLTDLKGHGTFVAGIISAKRNNGIGIAGINPGAVIMPLKVVGKEGRTNSLHIFRAIHYAVDNGARLINISLGGRGISKLEQHAVNYAYAHGVFVAVASGNTGDYLGNVAPASDRRVVTIGAIDFDGKRSTISSYGPNNGLMAPGEAIFSLQAKEAPTEAETYTDDKLYFSQSGTSFSTPMVTATASLLLAKNPKLTHEEIESILLGTASDMDDKGWDGMTGAGLLNAADALKSDREEFLTVKLNELNLNLEKKKVTSVDVLGTVRGDFDHFVVEVGKGKRAKRFKQVAGPFTQEADHAWLTRLIVKEHLRGSKEWIVQIRVQDKQGNVKTARALLELKRRN